MSSLPTYNEPLLNSDGQPNDGWQMQRLVVTVLAVSLGSSLQFGFATGSLNNLEAVVPASLPGTLETWQWALINSFFSIGGLIGSYGCVAPLAYLGRKKTLLWANLFVFLSSARSSTGGTSSWSPRSSPSFSSSCCRSAQSRLPF